MSRPSPLSLLALSGLAVSLPLLDLFGGYPQFFVAGGQFGVEVALFGIIVALSAPLAALALELLARLVVGASAPQANAKAFTTSLRASLATHTALVALFGVLLALVVLRKTPLQSDALILSAALLAGGGIAFAERHWQVVRRALAALSLTLLAALAIFLFLSPSSRLIWKGEAGAAMTQGIGNPVPVFIIVFDEFPVASLLRPDGSINAQRFPNFARLAGEAYWFRNASSVAPWTGASITSALTGQMPVGEKAPTSIDYPRNLFTLVGASYRMVVHEELTRLCPHSVCQGQDTNPDTGGATLSRLHSSLLDASVVYAHATLPPGLRARLPSLSHSWAGFLGQPPSPALPPSGERRQGEGEPAPPQSRTPRAQVTRFETFIASLQRSPELTLYFVHIVFPHFPWELTPDCRAYQPESHVYDDLKAIPGLRAEGDHWGSDAFLVRQGLQRHLMQVGCADRLIGQLMDRMKAEGMWDEALVIMFADHGVSFVPDHPRRGPTPETLDDIYRVPLFIKIPRQSGGETRDDNAMLIDVLPTLVDVLDVQTDWVFTGRSLLGDAPPPAEKRVTEAPGGVIPVSLDGLMCLANNYAATFHGREDWPGVAAVGEHGGLVGVRVDEAGLAWAGGYTWVIDQQADFQRVDIASGYMPVLITGRLILPVGQPPPAEALVAVNGVIAGIGGGFDCRGNECSFSALLMETALRAGANVVEVLVPARR